MGNKNDPNDPFYKAQTGWVWEPQFGSWIQTGGPNAGGPAPAPAPNPGPTGDARIGAQEAQVAAANRGATKETPLGTVSTPNKNPFTGGDLFAPDTFVAKGRDINTGAFGPTQQMAALKAMMQQGATSDATNATFDTAGAERARGSQDALLQQLLDQAAGRGPSPAQMMLQQAADRNLSDAAALTNTQRGLGATAASSQVAGQRAQIGQETARDAGILRLQEQMQAVQAAGGLASNMRGQDVGQAQAQAQVQLAKDNLNASMRQKYIDMGYSAEQADRMAMMDLEKMQTAQALTLTGMNQEEFQRGEKQRRDDFGTFLKSMGGVGDFLLSMFGGGGAAPAK
jgi:hypothetical protein